MKRRAEKRKDKIYYILPAVFIFVFAVSFIFISSFQNNIVGNVIKFLGINNADEIEAVNESPVYTEDSGSLLEDEFVESGIDTDESQSRGITGDVITGDVTIGADGGKIYHVKKDGTGDFTTIQTCADVVKAGETCLVYPGTYVERVTLKNSGATDAKIIFKSETKHKAVMHGFDTVNKNYVRIEGFNITSSGDVSGSRYGIKLTSNNTDIIDNYFFEVTDIAITGSGRSGNNIYVARNKVYKSNRGIVASGNNWLVENNDVERLFYYGSDADYSRFFGENITFRSNFFHGTTVVEKNDSHTDGFQTFITLTGSKNPTRNVIIEGNIIESFSQGLIAQDETDTGLISNILVRNNIFMGGDVSGSWGVDTNNVKNITFYNNLFLNIKGYGIGLKGSSTGLMYNNIFYNVSSSIGSCLGSNSNVTRGYNILFKCGRTGNYTGSDFIGVDPLFVNINPQTAALDLIGADGLPFTLDDGYILQSSSPAIDFGLAVSGVVDDDILGTSRPQGSAWDIGVYEYMSGGADTFPPSRSDGKPIGILAAGITSANLSLTTNEAATCKYSTLSGISYGSMTNAFSTTGGISHSTIVSGLKNGTAYTYYVKCKDNAGNENTDDYLISFSIASNVTKLKYFKYVMRSNVSEWFIVKMINDTTIQKAIDDLNGNKSLLVGGIINSGNGGFNDGWSWHMNESSIVLASNFIEVCDGTPSYVEATLPEWLGKLYCPWGAQINESYDIPPVLKKYNLTVSKLGSGSGVITGTGINCGLDCSENYTEGTSVTLTATANASSSFAGWSSACSGAGTCTVAVNANKAVIGTFNPLGGGAGGKMYYVREGAGGKNDGSDWTNAYTSLPATLERGATYYIADGNYEAYTFDDAISGEQYITIKKAIQSDHGSDVGWQTNYGDGIAEWSQWVFSTGYYNIDGQIGQWASDMPNYSSYGFVVRRNGTADNQNQIKLNTGVSNVIISHLESYMLNTPRSGTWYKSNSIVRGDSGSISATFNNVWFHDVGGGIYNGYTMTVIFDHSVLERNGQAQVAMNWSPSEHSEIAAVKNGVATFRYSFIRDWRSTGGLIAFDVNNPVVIAYGNVFTQTGYWASGEAADSNGVLNGLSGGSGQTILAYNNAFVNLVYGASVATMGNYASRIIKNNLFYKAHRISGNLNINGDHDYNWFYDSGTQSEPNIQNGIGDPFVNLAGKDYRLSAATASGISLDGQYGIDADGNTRGADGVWDRGAYEYVSGEAPPLCNLTSAVWSKTSAIEGEQVRLIVNGTNCDGKSINFVIKEKDSFSADDNVKINPSSVSFVGGTGTGTWTAEFQTDELYSLPEYYFTATLADDAAEKISSSTEGNKMLSVSPISSVNQAPFVNVGGDQIVTLTETNISVTLSGVVTDDDLPVGGKLTTQWSLISGPASVSFVNASNATTPITFIQSGNYTLLLLANDSEKSSVDDVSVEVKQPSEDSALPTVSIAVSDASASEPGTDKGVFAISREGGNLSQALAVYYIISENATNGVDYSSIAGNVLIAAGASSATITISPVDDVIIEGNESVVITIQNNASYNIGSPSSAILIIKDNDVANKAPIVNAGPDIEITLPNNSIVLDGTVSDDDLPVGGRLRTTWSKIAGDGAVTFGNISAIDTTATFSSAGSYILRLTANDSQLASYDDLSVIVNSAANKLPEVSIIAPLNNSIFIAPAAITISADANDSDGNIARVEFFADALKVGEDSAAPYSIVWSNVVNGSYILKARASDNSGAVKVSEGINVVVNNPENVSYLTCSGIAPETSAGTIIGPSEYLIGYSPTSWTFSKRAAYTTPCLWKCKPGYNKSGNTCIPGGNWKKRLSNSELLKTGSDTQINYSDPATNELIFTVESANIESSITGSVIAGAITGRVITISEPFSIIRNDINESESYLIIANLTLDDLYKKTLHLERLNKNSNGICITDKANLGSKEDILSSCTKVLCPNLAGNYICYVIDNEFVVKGLRHSGIVETIIEKEQEQPPQQQLSGDGDGDGGGGGRIVIRDDKKAKINESSEEDKQEEKNIVEELFEGEKREKIGGELERGRSGNERIALFLILGSLVLAIATVLILIIRELRRQKRLNQGIERLSGNSGVDVR